MSTGTATLSNPQPEPLSQVGRVVNTFFAPSKTFTDIRRSASWWLPFVLGAVISSAFMFMAVRKLGVDTLAQTQLNNLPKLSARLDQGPPEQKNQVMQSFRNGAKRAPYTTPIFQFVVQLIVAGVLLGTFNFAVGAALSYKQVLAVVMYSGLIGALKYVIAGIVLLAGANPEGFNIQNPLASNLSFLMDPASGFMYWFGMFIDLFAIWMLVLSAIGFSILSPKVKRSTALLVVFGWYVVFGLAMSALGSMFA